MEAKKNNPEYSKGTAPTGGIEYEVALQTLFALSRVQLFKNEEWRISNENKLCGKFDDLVYESDTGDILLQAKVKDKELTEKQFFSDTPSCADFSLPKYILSYNTIEDFNTKYLVLCTNSKIPLSIFEKKLPEESIITEIFGDCERYGINDTHVTTICELIKSFQEKIVVTSKKDEKYEWKNLNITESDVELFISKFLCIRVSERQMKTIIQEKLRFFRTYFPFCTYEYITDHVREWYKMDSKKAVYMKNTYMKSILFGEDSRNAAKKILEIPINFRTYFEFTSYKILCIKTQQEHDLHLKKILQGVRNEYKGKPEDMFYSEVLFISKDKKFEIINEIIECLKLHKIKYLIVCLTHIKPEQIKEICTKIKGIVKDVPTKRVFIVGGDFQFDHEYTNAIDSDINFDMLDDASQQRLLNTDIIFQGQNVKFKNCCSQAVISKIDESVIQKLILNDKYSIGENKDDLCKIKSYYIARKLSNEEVTFSEEQMFKKIRKKIVVLSGPPGAGKTTFLKKLIGTLIQPNDPQENRLKTWIINLELSRTINYLEKYRNRAEFLDLICNSENIKTPFETELIKALQKFVILDGIDETSSKYIQQLQRLLAENLNLNVSTVVIATRNYDFILKKLRTLQNLEIIALEPFSEENQLCFFKKYVHYKCKEELETKTVESLFENLRLFTPGIKNFCSTPFSIKLVAEILLENLNDSTRLMDAFSKEMNGYEFYKYFLDEKKHVYVNEEGESNWKMRELLSDNFDAQLKHLRTFAALSFPKSLLECLDTETSLNVSPSLLTVGVLEEINDNYKFVHKSFEEYFAAEYIWDNLLLKYTDSNLLETILNEIFLDVQYSGICDFFNGILGIMFSEQKETMADISERFSDILTQNNWNENRNISSLAFQGYLNIVKLVFDKYEKFSDIINIRGTSGETALHLSAHYPKFVKYLTEKEANLNALDENGLTVFHYIIMMCWDSDKYKIYFNMIFEKMRIFKSIKSIIFFDEYLKLLHRDQLNGYRCKINYDDILDLIKYLRGKGLDLNVVDRDGDTAVHWAAQADLLKMLKYLVEDCKINTDISDENDETPLHYACRFDAIDIVKYLHGRGSDIHVLNKDGATLIHSAAVANAINVLEYLITTCKMMPNTTDNTGNTPLHQAARKDALEAIKYLRRAGAALEAVNQNGDTILHKAATGNATKVLKYLIEDCGIDPNPVDNYGNTPLHDAASNDSVEAFQYLERNGSNLQVCNKHNDSVLHKAAWGNAINITRYLITKITLNSCQMNINGLNNFDETIIHKAAKENSMDVLVYLVEECTMDTNVTDKFGNTPLHDAAEKDAYEAITFLKQKNANLYATNSNGLTLIHKAALGNAMKVLRYLTKYCKMDINLVDNFGNTSLHYAARGGALDALKYIEQQNITLNVLNKNKDTLIHKAAWGNAEHVLKYLVEDCKLDINPANRLGTTPIHDAAKNNALEALKYFKAHQVDLNVVNDAGETIVHKAALGNAVKVLEFLMDECNIDMNPSDKYGNKPLHDACRSDSLETVQYFKKRNFNFNVINDDGDTVVHRAAYGNAVNVLKYLIEECSMDPSITDKYGNIPLHDAAERGSIEALKYLQIKGSSLYALNFDSQSLVHRAAMGNAVNSLKYLIEDCELDVNICDTLGNTLLHKAAEKDSLYAFKYLQSRGLNLQVVNKNRETLVHKAAEGNATNVLKYILETCKLEIDTLDSFGNTPLHTARAKDATDAIQYLENCSR